MCMGVNRSAAAAAWRRNSCPHVHGGEPTRPHSSDQRRSRCPHVHGGEPHASPSNSGQRVVPMCMGVNRHRLRLGEKTDGVVPMCMGVNRCGRAGRLCLCSCPHVHGGEPDDGRTLATAISVVPMCMGVNRDRSRGVISELASCPHVHGGEPASRRGSHGRVSCPHVHGGEPATSRTKDWRPSSCPHVHGGEPLKERFQKRKTSVISRTLITP